MATFLAALPLLFLGAEVTTKGVGMVDAAPVRSPWFFLAEFFEQHSFGWRIEHAHRQVGWVVGILAIALALASCLLDARGWVKALSVLTLAGVSTQGVLGMLRIHFNAQAIALVHGAFAQIVFALLLTMVVVTGRRWVLERPDEATLPWLRRWALATAAAAFVQVVLGGLIRHQDSVLGARLHLLGAFVVFAFAFVAIKCARETDYASFRRPARVLMALLTLQVMFGVEAWFAWMRRFFRPDLAATESAAVQLVRSAHYVLGALIFATVIVLTAKAWLAPRAGEAA